jgi:hypothetical protein
MPAATDDYSTVIVDVSDPSDVPSSPLEHSHAEAQLNQRGHMDFGFMALFQYA